MCTLLNGAYAAREQVRRTKPSRSIAVTHRFCIGSSCICIPNSTIAFFYLNQLSSSHVRRIVLFSISTTANHFQFLLSLFIFNMSDREESSEPMNNDGSPDGDDQQSNRSDSRQDSDREGSHHSENGHSPRPAGRSRSRSHSNSRRYSRSSRRSRSRSNSRRKYSRHSPDEKRGKRSRSPMSSRRRHVGNRENPPAGRCLGIFGLSIYTQERDLKDVFTKYGPLEDVQIVYDAQTGRSRGFAFVYFENKNDAAEAKERCNGSDIGGRKIRVDFSITQRAHTPTPGIYMGKPTHPRYRQSGGGGGGGSRGHRSYDRRRSPSPYYRRGRYSRSRSRSHSPRSRHYR